MTVLPRTVVCFTFDNMAEAADIGAGVAEGPRDDDPSLTIGYPRILALLDRCGVRSTFFLEGWNGIHHPDAVRWVADRNHEVGMHGWVHEQWAELDERVERRLAIESTDALAQASGQRPLGFRAPGGRRTDATEEILLELGYEYDASLGAGMVPTVHASGLAQVPFVWPGVDGYYYLRDTPEDPAVVEERWLHALGRAIEEGGLFLVIAHAFISGVDEQRLDVLDRVMTAAISDDRATVMSAGDIAQCLRAGSAS